MLSSTVLQCNITTFSQVKDVSTSSIAVKTKTHLAAPLQHTMLQSYLCVISVLHDVVCFLWHTDLSCDRHVTINMNTKPYNHLLFFFKVCKLTSHLCGSWHSGVNSVRADAALLSSHQLRRWAGLQRLSGSGRWVVLAWTTAVPVGVWPGLRTRADELYPPIRVVRVTGNWRVSTVNLGLPCQRAGGT